MAREDFFDSLRLADQLLPPLKANRQRSQVDAYISKDSWLRPDCVQGFDPADFADWPRETRDRLERDVEAFLAIAKDLPPKEVASKSRSKLARKHLEGAIRIVRDRLLPEWLEAQENMLQEATEAAQAKGWYVEKDEKQIAESLLGTYNAPRLLIRTWEKEMMLTPVARFCAGGQGVVDLKVSPTFERMYVVTFKDGSWRIVSLQGRQHKRPFTKDTFANTITKLSQV